MSKKVNTARSAVSGRFTTGALGASKSGKFLAVEGMALSPASKSMDAQLKDQGLRGRAYRDAVTKAFKTKRGE